MAAEKVLYIHIPTDILEETSPYRCPTTVNLELRDQCSPRKRAVGVYPPVSSRTVDSTSTVACDSARETPGQHGHTYVLHGQSPDGWLKGKSIVSPSVVNQQKKKAPESRLSR